MGKPDCYNQSGANSYYCHDIGDILNGWCVQAVVETHLQRIIN
jgi:hypothetical protein